MNNDTYKKKNMHFINHYNEDHIKITCASF